MPSYLLTDSHAVIRISGADAESFLQAQLTCNLDRLGREGLIQGAWCNPKGRIICYGYLTRDANDLLYVVARDLIEPVIKRLSMYVLRAKVEIGADGDLAVIGSLDDSDDPAPSDSSWRLLGSRPRYLALRSGSDSAHAAASSIANAGSSGDDLPWRVARIEAGEPWISAANSETCLPEHVNLDLNGAVDFDKGCFPGQEVVARMHYKGKGKTRLFVARAALTQRDAMPAPGPGTRVLDRDDRAVGTVIESAVAATGSDRGDTTLIATITAPSDSAESNHGLRLDLDGESSAAIILEVSLASAA